MTSEALDRRRQPDVLANFPLASIVISGAITTALVGVLVWRMRRTRRTAKKDSIAAAR